MNEIMTESMTTQMPQVQQSSGIMQQGGRWMGVSGDLSRPTSLLLGSMLDLMNLFKVRGKWGGAT